MNACVTAEDKLFSLNFRRGNAKWLSSPVAQGYQNSLRDRCANFVLLCRTIAVRLLLLFMGVARAFGTRQMRNFQGDFWLRNGWISYLASLSKKVNDL